MKLPSAVRWLFLAAYASLVTVLSLLPPKSLYVRPPAIPHLDKIAHGLMYGVLAALVCWIVKPNAHQPRRLLLVVVTVGMYGWAMEWAQRWFTHGQRAYEVGDALSNMAGALLITVIWALFHRAAPAGFSHHDAGPAA